jgi:acyl-CoA dehydrogenase
MNFELTQDQKDMQEMAMKFAKNELIPVAAKYDEEGIFPKEEFKKAWELGLINTCIPAEYGGAGFSEVEAVMIGETLAYGCMGINTSFMANDLALLPIKIAGTHEQKEKFLRPFTEEFKIASFCLTEPGYGSDAAGIQTTIKEDGDHWVINGEKMWITNAGHASLFVVYCTVDPSLKHKGISAIVVSSNLDGIQLGKKEHKLGQNCSDTRSITFNNVRVPKENILGKPGEGWAIAMKTLDHSRPLVSSIALGGSQRALDLSIEYAKERKQFGVPIAKHQAVQFMIADMATKVEVSRMLIQKAAWMSDNDQRNTLIASSAKVFAADSCMQITTDAVQIYGGYGYSKEYPVEKLMRDAKLIQIYEGTSQIQKIVIAREVLGKT